MLKISKRIFLFLLTNVAVLAMITFITLILRAVFKVDISGSSLFNILFFSAIIGFSGALISLYLSKWTAKQLYSLKTLQESQLLNYTPKEQLVYTIVARIAQENGIQIPEIAVYQSADPNAFATGPNKNNALVAVSSGLLETMWSEEIQGIVGHEMAHVLNGDMVTLTLIQGIVNTFVVFFARVVSDIVDKYFFGDDNGGGFAYAATYFILQMVFSTLAMGVVMYFSRIREYSADADGARLAGKENVLKGLKRLQLIASTHDLPQEDNELSAFKISSSPESGLKMFFSSHPSLSDRIRKLESMAL